MRTHKSNYIGVIVSNIADPFFAELYLIIDNIIKEYGYKTILFNSPYGQENQYFQSLYHWNIDGVIFCFNGNITEWYKLTKENKRNIPFVMIETSMNEIEYDRVLVNIEEGMYKAVKHLIKHGEHKVAFFGGTLDWPDPRIKGYVRALKEEGLEIDLSNIFQCDFSTFGGEMAAGEFLDLKDRPSAIVTVNDSIAFGAMKFFLRRGIRIPEDISIIGFDDNSLAKMSYPELSTVRIPIKTVGENASRLLINRIENKAKKSYSVTVSTELIIRESTK